MNCFRIDKDQHMPCIYISQHESAGVKRIASTVADDISLVINHKPDLISSMAAAKGHPIIIAATLGLDSEITTCLNKEQIDTLALSTQKESYLFQILNEKTLLILGSDKRGTIYGLFHLSELCGISPLVYFGDATPLSREEIILKQDTVFLSKEPSVEYRGFFINDEWPAFGNWCTDRFAGVNAKAYKNIFELLLRLKGNYLWPAMWSSSFSEDGPGIENARLADEYGVIMGTSHHEPLCRAGVEWQRQYQNYGEDSTWSILSNEKPITEFWRDGLLRNRNFENLYTIGMRGEADSKLLPENATLADNIEVVKKAIHIQHDLLSSCLNKKIADIPQMIAIYKEVEDFYYGDDTCEGLRGWDELRDVTFLLSDDNYGNLRGLPEPQDRSHPGGFGMYYHFDYHGAPVSYEWLTSTTLAKTWEQMTTAYEYGVKKIWVVNVGDLKGNEYPLSFFLDLAYDFDKWGTSNLNAPSEYSALWISKNFPAETLSTQKDIQKVLNGYIKWNSFRRPETLNTGIHNNATYDHIHHELTDLMSTAKTLKSSLHASSQNAYLSMVYYEAMASLNNFLMNLEAGRNHFLAGRGSLRANMLADITENCIQKDHDLIQAFHSFSNGKWTHMMDSAHTGFRSWDDNDWGYPVIHRVSPLPTAKIMISFRGGDQFNLGNHWQDRDPICNTAFLNRNTKEVILDIDSRGSLDFTYEVRSDKDWLHCTPAKGSVIVDETGGTSIRLSCERGLITDVESAHLQVDFTFENGEKKQAFADIRANSGIAENFLHSEYNNRIEINASEHAGYHQVDNNGWCVIKDLGLEGDAIKSLPPERSWSLEKQRPAIHYAFYARYEKTYHMHIFLAARNPDKKGGRMQFSCQVNDGPVQKITTLSEHYYTEWYNMEWNHGVMDNYREVCIDIPVLQGQNVLTLFAGDAGIVIHKIIIEH